MSTSGADNFRVPRRGRYPRASAASAEVASATGPRSAPHRGYREERLGPLVDPRNPGGGEGGADVEEREAAARAHHRSPLRASGRHRHDRPHLRVGTWGGGAWNVPRRRQRRPGRAPVAHAQQPAGSVSGSGTTREGELETGARGAPRVPTRARGSQPSSPTRKVFARKARPGPARSPPPKRGNWEKPRPQSRVWRPLHRPPAPHASTHTGRGRPPRPTRAGGVRSRLPIGTWRNMWPTTGAPKDRAPGGSRARPRAAPPGVGRQPRSGTRKNQEAWPDTEGPTPGRPRGRGTAFPQFLLGRRPRAADTVRAA